MKQQNEDRPLLARALCTVDFTAVLRENLKSKLDYHLFWSKILSHHFRSPQITLLQIGPSDWQRPFSWASKCGQVIISHYTSGRKREDAADDHHRLSTQSVSCTQTLQSSMQTPVESIPHRLPTSPIQSSECNLTPVSKPKQHTLTQKCDSPQWNTYSTAVLQELWHSYRLMKWLLRWIYQSFLVMPVCGYDLEWVTWKFTSSKLSPQSFNKRDPTHSSFFPALAQVSDQNSHRQLSLVTI